MNYLHRLSTLACAFAVLLAACAPQLPIASTSVPAKAPAQTAAASPTAVPTDEPAGLAVPAIQYGQTDSELVLASSLTGQPLRGFAPIPLGDTYSYAFAPDGHTLAVVYAATLYLIGLPSGLVRTVDVGLHGFMSALAFAPDGNLLALAGNAPDATLLLVDTRAEAVTASAQAGFAVHNMQFTSDGQRLMIYGPQLAESGQAANVGVSVGNPGVALLSGRDLHVLWAAKLAGLRDGTFPKPDATDLYQPGAASHYSPGIAFAPDADILYAVHGDSDRLTTVDFTQHSVKTVVVHPKTGWLERLLAWTAGVAYAKGMDGTTRQAVISPDGKLLYVVGTTSAVSKPEGSSEWQFTFTQDGLEVIAVEDGSLVQKLDTPAYAVGLAHDDRHLLLSGWSESSNTPWTDIYDLSSMQVVKHLDGVQLIPARRADGAIVLQSSVMLSGNKCSMASVDPHTWSTIASWTGWPCSNWLADP